MKGVLVVAQHTIHGSLLQDEPKGFHGVTGDSNVPDFSGLLNFAECREGFVDDLLHGDELDVMAEENIEVVRAKPVQADIDALGNPFCREVKVLEVVTAEFRAEGI